MQRSSGVCVSVLSLVATSLTAKPEQAKRIDGPYLKSDQMLLFLTVTLNYSSVCKESPLSYNCDARALGIVLTAWQELGAWMNWNKQPSPTCSAHCRVFHPLKSHDYTCDFRGCSHETNVSLSEQPDKNGPGGTNYKCNSLTATAG